jgi:hypothetical protein
LLHFGGFLLRQRPAGAELGRRRCSGVIVATSYMPFRSGCPSAVRTMAPFAEEAVDCARSVGPATMPITAREAAPIKARRRFRMPVILRRFSLRKN